MVEIKLKEIGGLILCVITLTSAAVIYLQETGKYKTCSGGWILMEDGMYDCPTRDILPQWCHHGSDEGPENIGYRCYLGVPIIIPKEEPKPIAENKFIQSADCLQYKEYCYCNPRGSLIKKRLCSELE